MATNGAASTRMRMSVCIKCVEASSDQTHGRAKMPAGDCSVSCRRSRGLRPAVARGDRTGRGVCVENVSLVFTTWNRIGQRLRQVEGLRQRP